MTSVQTLKTDRGRADPCCSLAGRGVAAAPQRSLARWVQTSCACIAPRGSCGCCLIPLPGSGSFLKKRGDFSVTVIIHPIREFAALRLSFCNNRWNILLSLTQCKSQTFNFSKQNNFCVANKHSSRFSFTVCMDLWISLFFPPFIGRQLHFNHQRICQNFPGIGEQKGNFLVISKMSLNKNVPETLFRKCS